MFDVVGNAEIWAEPCTKVVGNPRRLSALDLNLILIEHCQGHPIVSIETHSSNLICPVLAAMDRESMVGQQ